ncbi:MAG: MFS transporter [Asgard group archaeon]|nr:MFS transporter [Asgard group archaeon]
MPDPNSPDERIQSITAPPPDFVGTEEYIVGDFLDEGLVDLSDDELAKIPERGKLFGRSSLMTFTTGLVDPFLTTIAIDMGITGGQMGWLRATTNLLSTLAQPFFGFISDTVQRRSIFIALSSILYSSVWILLLFINDVIMIIIMAGIISLAFSLGTPAWTALLGEVTPIKIRGKIIATVNYFSQFSYILATIIGGILLNFISGQFSIGSRIFPLNMFLPISLGLLTGFISAFLILSFKEKKAKNRAKKLSQLIEEREKKQPIKTTTKDSIVEKTQEADKDQLSKPSITVDKNDAIDKKISDLQMKDKKRTFRVTLLVIRKILTDWTFMKFTIVMSFQLFFMSMMWPLFPIRQRSDISANYFEIAIFSVLMGIATVLTIRYAGQISDLIGRKPQMFMNRLILITMPLSYMFASKVWHIMVIHVLICIPLGLNSAVMQAYLIDITPEKRRSTYVGFYNMITGIMLFFGSLFGGYLVDFLMGETLILGFSPFYAQYKAVTIAFAVGFVGRLITAFPFLTLKEVKKFPYKLKDLPKLILKSKKLLAFASSVSLFLGITFIFMGAMGYLQ